MIDYLADHADALPASLMDGLAAQERRHVLTRMRTEDRKSTRLNSSHP